MGRPASDMTGLVFGRLTVLERDYTEYNGHNARWKCRCSCGTIKVLVGGKLRQGEIQSCGCLLKDKLTTHGLTETAEYRIWRHVKGRTRSESNNNYKRYGARGITMCEEWWCSFETFYKDMGPRPGPEYSIERKDNNKGYSKENCRWATKTEQANNRSSNVFYTRNGVSRTLSNWCRELNLDYNFIRERIRSGWTFEKAISTPKSK